MRKSVLLSALVAVAYAGPAVCAELPINHVTLFKSGVGFFEHAGQVHPDSTVTVNLRQEQVNDVLKSLVVNDPEGAIKEVRYPSKDPLKRSLAGFAIDLSQANSLPDILRQVRGAELELMAPEKITGRLVTVHQQANVINETTVLVTWLSIATEAGLRHLQLSDVANLRLLDPKLNRELTQALVLLGNTQTEDRRQLSLNFGGKKPRSISFGYLSETPVWKTAWRLQLGAQPSIQGWALIENTSDEDWTNVTLSLVSGQPIAFTMDLYSPLYAVRPEVQVPRPAQIEPRVFEGATLDYDNDAAAPAFDLEETLVTAQKRSSAAPAMRPQALNSAASAGGPINTSQIATSAPGELFEFSLKEPISLPRRTSAMLPIADTAISAEKLSIYRPGAPAMHGVLLKNTSSLKLMAGPVTVFDQGYAGDAQIGYIAPGAQRLLTYAVDLELKAEMSAEFARKIDTAQFYDGALVLETSERFHHNFVFTNESDKVKTVVLEKPKDADRKLIEPSDVFETTESDYRFKLNVAAQRSREFRVTEERILQQRIGLFDYPLRMLINYSENGEIDKQVRDELKNLVAYKRRLDALRQTLQEHTQERLRIQQGQERLRQNIAAVGKDSSLGQRYQQKLATEEDAIEQLDRQIKQDEADIQKAETQFRNQIATL